jgi:hypothetical protein
MQVLELFLVDLYCLGNSVLLIDLFLINITLAETLLQDLVEAGFGYSYGFEINVEDQERTAQMIDRVEGFYSMHHRSYSSQAVALRRSL